MHGKSILTIGILVLLLGAAAAIGLAAYQEHQGTTGTAIQKQSEDLLTFAVFGDNEGTGPVLDAIIEDINGRNVDFVVQLGDATAHTEPQEFIDVREAFARFTAPVYVIPGNNDIIGDPDYTQWKEAFGFARWYAVTQQETQFLFLDNANRRVGFPEEERTWLKNELQRSTASRTVIFYHRPFSLPLENVFGDDETPVSRASNDDFLRILGEYNVNHIYTGHIHTYLPYTLQDIPVTVSGGGGALPQNVLGGDTAAFFHYLLVHVREDGITQELLPIRT